MFRASLQSRILSNTWAKYSVMEGLTAQPLVGIGEGTVSLKTCFYGTVDARREFGNLIVVRWKGERTKLAHRLQASRGC